MCCLFLGVFFNSNHFFDQLCLKVSNIKIHPLNSFFFKSFLFYNKKLPDVFIACVLFDFLRNKICRESGSISCVCVFMFICVLLRALQRVIVALTNLLIYLLFIIQSENRFAIFALNFFFRMVPSLTFFKTMFLVGLLNNYMHYVILCLLMIG